MCVVLQRLSETNLCSVTIISGRALNDVRERVGLPNIIYAGNHGLEIQSEGLNFVEPEAVRCIKILGELSRRLRERVRHIPGVEIEDKVLTVSVHFRKVQRGSLDEIRQAVQAELAFSEGIFRVDTRTPGSRNSPRRGLEQGYRGPLDCGGDRKRQRTFFLYRR